jgi:hypothetical protein
MSRSPSREKRKKTLDRASKAIDVVGTGGRIAAGAAGVTGAAAALVLMLPSALKLALPKVLERKANETKQWWDWVTMVDAPDETVRAEIEAHLDNPDAQEAIYSSLKEVLDCTNSEVLKPLAMLTREYVREDKAPDAFFRGVTRVLADLTRGELKALRLLVRLAADVEKRLDPGMLAVDLYLTRLEKSRDETEYVHHREIAPPKLTLTPLRPSVPGAERLFHLLKSNGLGSDQPSGMWDVQTGPSSLLLDRRTLTRLVALLRE